MKRIALYRLHYGFEYLYKSIQSVHNWADEIVVVISREPWFKEPVVNYQGKNVELHHPEDVDYHHQCLNLIPNVTAVFREHGSTWDHWGTIIREFKSDYDFVLTVECDMVFDDYNELYKIEKHTTEKTPTAMCHQIEYWKNEFWRIAPRPNRVGPVMYKKPPDELVTERNNMPHKKQRRGSDNMFWVKTDNPKTSICLVKNYGFCWSPEVTFYKHLLALGSSRDEGEDTPPDESWFDLWYGWVPEDLNLEIPVGYQYRIKNAYLCEEYTE